MSDVRLAFLVFALACGSGGRVVTLETPDAAMPPTTTPNAPEPFACDGPQRATIAPVSRLPRQPPNAGLMSEQAASAKRLFNSEKWDEAIAALRKVVDGTSGDDEGNKQLAAYQVAVALFHARSFAESYAAFHAIARDRNRLKQQETILWLTKISQDHPELVDITDFDFYSRDEISIFNNESQRDLYGSLNFFLGRARMFSGETAEAAALLGNVPSSNAYAARAAKCLTFALR